MKPGWMQSSLKTGDRAAHNEVQRPLPVVVLFAGADRRVVAVEIRPLRCWELIVGILFEGSVRAVSAWALAKLSILKYGPQLL